MFKNKILICGYGWTGSSALIDFLNSSYNESYYVMLNEFDDFRYPNSMRNAFENNNKPIIRRSTKKKLLHYFLRGVTPDLIYPNFLKLKNLKPDLAWEMFYSLYGERRIFYKYAELIYRSKERFNKEKFVELWFNSLLEFYKRSNPNAETIFIDQLLLFDDQPEIYNWVGFDNLILFIRDPYYQLQATLEDKTIYEGYPFQAQAIIGGGSRFEYRKIELFLETTRLRYSWIINFLKYYKKEQITIIDFSDFLKNYEKTITYISNILDIDFTYQKNNFNILESQRRNKKWHSENSKLDLLLRDVKESFYNFRKYLYTNFSSMY